MICIRRRRTGYLSSLLLVGFTIASLLGILSWPGISWASRLLIPMDLSQLDHLKAYGVAYWCLTQGFPVEWLLNYRGGSFMTEDAGLIRRECNLRGVSFESISGGQAAGIYAPIEEENMEVVLLEKAPRIAVYTPPDNEPWDDAVTLALTYAEIPYTGLYDEEVLAGNLDEYDWLHLHHEDFTGQYGKFYAAFHNAQWYQDKQQQSEARARAAGFGKVSQHKLAVAQVIKAYVATGGFMFAMCSATDSYDIALSAEGVDFLDSIYDGDPMESNAQGRLDFGKCLFFQNFGLRLNPLEYEFSEIDATPAAIARGEAADYFSLFEFSAKFDPIPCMLVQNHVSVVKGFLGQTTSYGSEFLKPGTVFLGEVEGWDEVKYIHRNYGRGTVTFLGGHDPEDYQHAVGDPPTDLSLHKNSPGYRLILNNILFPAARKKPRKT